MKRTVSHRRQVRDSTVKEDVAHARWISDRGPCPMVNIQGRTVDGNQQEEIHKAVAGLSNLKSPWPDRMTNEFYKKKAWNTLKSDLGVFHDFFQNGIISRRTSKTFVCLIPKKKGHGRLTISDRSIWFPPSIRLYLKSLLTA